MSSKLKKTLSVFKSTIIGAACYKLNIGNGTFCANGLTEDQAKAFAVEQDLTLIKWEAGKTCSQMDCGSHG